MIFSTFFFSIFILINTTYCSNFRSFSEKSQFPELNFESSNETNSLITLSAEQPNITDSFPESPSTRQMDDILMQEKPVLLNTIPHTVLSHNLFVNSSGLFTNITVVLTSTVPIAVVSSENDSIHRILSGSEPSESLGNFKTDLVKISDKISKSMEGLPTEILNIIENTADYFKKLSSLLAGVVNLEDNSLSNSTVLVSHNDK
ncbi:uncharacterized protein cubi_01408 [Cryptosporidium ubiquitum]|uniref:Uncharacterized protein n=1 Tax=Cryptosporidium ubiquitum TaxID=857276 RepID=A0A1J4MF23_9CRYT|nr:uncharacterized protein cubi_01408 [Cryptosporidium ubiquitum]OII72075.1 hypothetical protein cubi_01408 [Cryptosporidium ubiquitum]